jgi:hypothetical protein
MFCGVIAATSINGGGGIYPYNTTFEPTRHIDFEAKCSYQACPLSDPALALLEALA